jgi:hypothetical protein
LDLADLLAAVAASTDTPVEKLLPVTDLQLLCLIAQRTRDQVTPAAAVSEMLVGIAAGRPFPSRNAAAAWALAALVADDRRCRLSATPRAALQLVRDAQGGAGEAAIALRLARLLRRRRPAVEALARWWTVPPRPGPVVWACPVCGRAVRVAPCRSSILLLDPLAHDVVTDCARQAKDHDRGIIGRDYGALTQFRGTMDPDRRPTLSST